MATAIPDSTNLVSIEETDFSSSVSEAVFQKLGGGINYAINTAAGFDSRLDDLETKTSFLPTSWVYSATPTIYAINGGGDISGNFPNRHFSYIIEKNKLFWSIFLTGSTYVVNPRCSIQLPAITVDTAKLPTQLGATKFIMGAQQMYLETEAFVIGDAQYYMGPVPLFEGSFNRIQILRNTNASGVLPLV